MGPSQYSASGSGSATATPFVAPATGAAAAVAAGGGGPALVFSSATYSYSYALESLALSTLAAASNLTQRVHVPANATAAGLTTPLSTSTLPASVQPAEAPVLHVQGDVLDVLMSSAIYLVLGAVHWARVAYRTSTPLLFESSLNESTERVQVNAM